MQGQAHTQQRVNPPTIHEQKDLDSTIPYLFHEDSAQTKSLSNTSLHMNHQLEIEVQQQRLLEAISLSSAEVMKFDGNPLHYHEFVTSFDNLIGGSLLQEGTKLMKLLQCCTDQVKIIIKSCLMVEPSLGYRRIRAAMIIYKDGDQH
eukprot:XP_011676398.1 PREDICTED: uncharacterized protein LOC105444179 [Strongylocentrotus purpuratus]